MIIPIKLSLSNAYLILEEKPILVDSGSPGEELKIISALAEHGIKLKDLSLIIHTHIHGDHVGSTNALLELANIPVGFHQADLPFVEGANNGELTGIGLRGNIMARFFAEGNFDPPKQDVDLIDGFRTDSYGAAGKILHTPGHTAGSISIVLDDGNAIIGDLLMGGYIGGALFPHKPMYHYFADDLTAVNQSIHKVLQEDAHTLFVGHGGSLKSSRVRNWFTPQRSIKTSYSQTI